MTSAPPNSSFQTNRCAAAELSRWASCSVLLDIYAPKAYSAQMLTVVETTLFQRQWPLLDGR
jgi:hypothetical protein